MGQNCCAENKNDKSRDYMTAIDGLGKYQNRPSIRADKTPTADGGASANKRNIQEVKLEKFMKRHRVNQLLYYSKGGLFESYVCGSVGGSNNRRNESSAQKKKDQIRNRLV